MKRMLFLMVLFIATTGFAQDSTKNKVDAELMQKYFMVFLYRGEAWTPERTPEVEKIQKGHLENIGRLAKEGKMVLAGPFMDNGQLRGIFIFNVATEQEVTDLCASDPAIAAKRLRIEIKPWYGPKALLKVNDEYFKK